MKNIRVGIEKLTKGAVVILSTKFMVSPFEKVTFEQRLKGSARYLETIIVEVRDSTKARRWKPAVQWRQRPV